MKSTTPRSPLRTPTGNVASGSRRLIRPGAPFVPNPSTGSLSPHSLTGRSATSLASTVQRPAGTPTAVVKPRLLGLERRNKLLMKLRPMDTRSSIATSRPIEKISVSSRSFPSSLTPLPLTTTKPSNLSVAFKPPFPAGFIHQRRDKSQQEAQLVASRNDIQKTNALLRRMFLEKQAVAMTRGRKAYSAPASFICAICCVVIVLCVILATAYLLNTTDKGKDVMRKARRLLFNGTTSHLRPANSTEDDMVRVVVDLLTYTMDGSFERQWNVSGQRPKKGVTIPSTAKTVSPCKRVLCPYQTSRWKLNPAVHPCDDFYSYVCGNWSETGSNDSASFETDQNKETEAIIRTLLQSARVEHDDLASSLFETCQEHVSYVDSKLFIGSLLQRVGLAKWPYKDNVLSKTQMWHTHARIFRTLGVSPLVAVSFGGDPRNGTRSVITLSAPQLFVNTVNQVRLPRWYLPSLYRATSIFDPDFYEDVSQRVLQFVGKLAGLVSQYKAKPRPSTVGNQPFYAALLKFSFEGILTVNTDTPIILKNQAYLKNLKSLIGSTKSSSVYNYLGFRVLVHMSPLLSEEFSVIGRARMAWLTGRWQSNWPLWQTCIRFIDDMDPTLLLSTYQKFASPHLQLVDVKSHLREIMGAFRKHVIQIEWCAADKFSRCSDFVNSTSINLVNSTAMHLEPLFGNLTSGYFLEEYVTFKRRMMEATLARPQAALSSVLSPFSLSPSFDARTKTLYMPIVPFFNVFHDREDDLQVRNVNLIHDTYWSLLESLRVYLFSSRARSSLPSKCDARRGLNRDGKSVEELVQDTAAWELTVKHFENGNWTAFSLMDNLNAEKSLFVFSAIGKCQNEVAASLSAELAMSSHSTAQELINVPLSNSLAFGRVWPCRNGTMMNTAKKCTLWQSQ